MLHDLQQDFAAIALSNNKQAMKVWFRKVVALSIESGSSNDF